MSAAARVRSLALKKSGLQARLACQMVSDFGRGGKRGGEGERWGGGGERVRREGFLFLLRGPLKKCSFLPSLSRASLAPFLRFRPSLSHPAPLESLFTMKREKRNERKGKTEGRRKILSLSPSLLTHRELSSVEHEGHAPSSRLEGLDRRDAHHDVQYRPNGPEGRVGRREFALLEGVVPTLSARGRVFF